MAVAAKKNPFLFDASNILEVGLKKFREFKSNSSTCYVGYLFKDGSIHNPASWVCHANLGYPPNPDKVEYIVNYTNSAGVSDDPAIKRAFVEWLVLFSPYRSVFVSTDVDQIMKDTFVVASVDHPYNLMAGGLQALRALSEHPSTGKIWYELVKHGVHPNLAFYISYAFKTDGKNLWEGTSSHTGCWTPSCTYRDVLVNFLTENFITLKDKYRKTNSYQSAQLIFGTNGGGNVVPILVKQINAIVNKKAGTANPFAKPVKGDRWPLDKGIEALATAIKNEFKPELEKLNGKA